MHNIITVHNTVLHCYKSLENITVYNCKYNWVQCLQHLPGCLGNSTTFVKLLALRALPRMLPQLALDLQPWAEHHSKAAPFQIYLVNQLPTIWRNEDQWGTGEDPGPSSTVRTLATAHDMSLLTATTVNYPRLTNANNHVHTDRPTRSAPQAAQHEFSPSWTVRKMLPAV